MSEPRSAIDNPVEHDPFAGAAILSTAPCTEPQRELWTSCQLGDDASLAFNESVSVWLRGALDEDALRAALADLSVRHEALNITFPRVVTEPFDLVSGPLLRTELVVLSPSEHVLTLTAHHIVVDGWSIAVLVRD